MKNKQVFITFQLKDRKNHDRNRRVEDKVMGRKKEGLSIFEQMGGTYTEKDGILYPNILIGEEKTETMQNTFSGKYGDLWKKYLKENKPERYYDLARTGQLKQNAAEVNEEANELLDRIM